MTEALERAPDLDIDPYDDAFIAYPIRDTRRRGAWGRSQEFLVPTDRAIVLARR